MSTSTDTTTLHYWGSVRSRNMYSGYILAGFNLSDKVTLNGAYPYPGTPEWNSAQPKSCFGLLPVLTDANDTTISESGAINRYLIKKFNLEPESLKDYGMMNTALEAAAAIHGALSTAQYSPDRTAAMDATFTVGTGKVMKLLAGCETLFSDGSVFICDAMNPGDLALAAGLQLIVDLQPDALDTFPKCKALHEAVSALEGIVKFNAAHAYPYFKRNSD